MLTLSLDCLSSSCILCAQCWHCLSIVYLHPVSCVPNVDSVSRLFIFILYLVCPMLTLSLDCLSSSCILCTQCWHCLLDCLSSSCILCTQCWQCLSIVYLHPLSCVPNVDSVSRVFIFILYLVSQCWQCLSMVCLHPVSCVPNVDSVSRLFVFILILCTQCWHCLSIVYLHPVSCVPNVDTIERHCQHWAHKIQDRLFIFILYLVCPMLTLSLECLSSSCILCAQCWHCLSIVYLHPVSCVPNVDTIERHCQHWVHKIQDRLFIFILYLVYPMLTLSLDCLSSSCILCTQCWQCLSIVYLHPVSCVPNVDSVSRVFIFILYLVSQCWQCLSMVCLHPVSCVPNVDIVSRLFIFILYLVYPMLTVSLDCLSSSCILCAQCWHCLSSVYLHPVSCVPNVDIVSRLFIFFCILCTQCWQCLSIIYLHPVSCVPNVDIVSRLFMFILYLVYPMLTVSLDCLSSSCILCTQCWQCLSIIYLHPVSCVPNVDIFSRVFIFILYLVCPMLTLSLDYLSSSCILCTQCWQCLSIVYLHPVSCVPNVDSVSEDKQSRDNVNIGYTRYRIDCLSSSCILCTQYWHCLSIVYLHPVSCVPNVDIVSRLFIFILYLVCLMLTVSLECLSSSCILCPNVDSVSRLFIFILYLVCPMLTVSLHCFSSSCILYTQCWHNRETLSTLGTQDTGSIVYLHPVSCVPNVDIVSRVFIFILYLVCPMLTLSLKIKCLSIVSLHPVSCVPNVDTIERHCQHWAHKIQDRLFIFILYLVYPMLTLSLDCLSSSCILCAQCWHNRETLSTLGTQDTGWR